MTKIKTSKTPSGYSIQCDGTTYNADRAGDKFVCNGYTGTLKQCKEQVMNWETKAKDSKDDSIWECVHPCALLALMPEIPEWLQHDVTKTLDAYGWIKDGSVDKAAAERELRIWAEIGLES